MLSAKDVADYFLLRAEDDDAGEGITNLKIQKLVYYAQGVSLALYGEPLFSEDIEAWAHGPVVPDLYHAYKQYGSDAIPSPQSVDLDKYTDQDRYVLDEVYSVFGQFSAWKLRNMTHEEPPWKNAWKEDQPNVVITRESMRDYFRTIVTDG